NCFLPPSAFRPSPMPLALGACPAYNQGRSLGVSAVGVCRRRAESRPWDLIRVIPAWESDLTSPRTACLPASLGPSLLSPVGGRAVELFAFFRWVLVITVTTT